MHGQSAESSPTQQISFSVSMSFWGLASGAVVLSKPRRCTSGELQRNAEHPSETDPNIPYDGQGLVKDDHINRYECGNGGEECADGAQQRDGVRPRTRTGAGKSTAGCAGRQRRNVGSQIEADRAIQDR